MKVSTIWLQKYLSKPLPQIEKIAEAFTFHAFEVEEVGKDSMEVKVLPNRAADCLSHRGLAKELSAILNLPIKDDPLRKPLEIFPKTEKLSISIDKSYVNRHMGALVKGVRVKESPSWLKEALEAVGQRPINNIVDITNYIMLDIGQPMHAFDAGKIAWKGDTLFIEIRKARPNEKITVLTGEEYTLDDSMYVIADATSGTALDIAGLKGGFASGITKSTTDIFISVGNYDPTLIRRMSQQLKLFTDASLRYQNHPSTELNAYGMREVLKLAQDIAEGELVGVVDEYPKTQEQKTVSVTVEKISKHLGADYLEEEIVNVFTKLDFSFAKEGTLFRVTPPFERRDIIIAEDLVEEVGRIVGYDYIPATEFPAIKEISDQARFRGIERMKDMLVEKGFIEVSTQSFTKKGDISLANPLDKTRPALRKSLEETLTEAFTKAKYYAPLVLNPVQKPKLFEVGTVFPKEGEYLELRMTERVPEWGDKADVSDNLSLAKLDEYGKDYKPLQSELGAYVSFSPYPFALRDIALWVSATDEKTVRSTIQKAAGELLYRIDLFDTFEKDNKKSYAFRLVFQSTERTLSDEEISTIMKNIETAVSAAGWEVR